MDKTDFSFHIPPPEKGRDYYKQTLDYRHVLPGTISQWRNIKGQQRKAANLLKKPIEEISNEELAKLIVSCFIEQSKVEPASERKQQNAVERKMEQYLSFYEAKTANDLSSLRSLCSLEVAIEELENIERVLLKTLQDPKRASNISDSYINSIGNTRIKYLAEHRQQQTLLGIDRLTRDKRENEQGSAEYHRQLLVASRDLMGKKAVKIVCANCASTGTLLQQGFILCHFDNWRWEGKCPKCGKPIKLNSNPVVLHAP